MGFTLIALLITLCASSVASLTHFPIESQDRSSQKANQTFNDNETSPTYRFKIEKCGPWTWKLASLLDEALRMLPDAIDEMKIGVQSNHGYEAFFKHDGLAFGASRILNQIHRIEPLEGLRPDPGIPSAPVFVCGIPDIWKDYPDLPHDPWRACQTTAAFASLGTKYVFICPQFWLGTRKPSRDRGSVCPLVTRNEFHGVGSELFRYQPLDIIHELVHFYLGLLLSLGSHTVPTEKYDINSCVGLNAFDSARNPTNYQAFVAMVWQGCTAAPNPFLPPYGGRIIELINSSGNDTSYSGSIGANMTLWEHFDPAQGVNANVDSSDATGNEGVPKLAETSDTIPPWMESEVPTS